MRKTKTPKKQRNILYLYIHVCKSRAGSDISFADQSDLVFIVYHSTRPHCVCVCVCVFVCVCTIRNNSNTNQYLEMRRKSEKKTPTNYKNILLLLLLLLSACFVSFVINTYTKPTTETRKRCFVRYGNVLLRKGMEFWRRQSLLFWYFSNSVLCFQLILFSPSPLFVLRLLYRHNARSRHRKSIPRDSSPINMVQSGLRALIKKGALFLLQ